MAAFSRSIGIFLLILPQALSAYVCSRTNDKLGGGPSLYWEERIVVMRPALGSDETLNRKLIEAMEWAAEQWTQTDYSDIQIKIEGPTDQKWVGFDWFGGTVNQNIVVIRNTEQDPYFGAWAYEKNQIALTKLTFMPYDGRIVDADIELNGDDYIFDDCVDESSCEEEVDLKNTLTHEFGHVLGFDHPKPRRPQQSIMEPYATRSEISKRKLYEEDKRGLKAVYPIGQPAQNCFPEYARETVPDVVVTEGYGCRQASFSAHWTLWFLLIALRAFSRRLPVD